MKLKPRFLAWLFFVILRTPAFAADPALLNPDSERIMEVLLSDRTIVEETLIVYQAPRFWQLPLVQLGQSLGFSLSPVIQQEAVGGTLGSSARPFLLNARECWIEVERKNRATYPCEWVIRSGDEYYVKLEAVAEWLSLNISVNSAASTIEIESLKALPIEERRERELRAQERERDTRLTSKTIPKAPVRHPKWDGPVTDQSLQYRYRREGSKQEGEFSGYSLFTGTAMGWDSALRIAYQKNQVDQVSGTIEKRSRESRLFGKLGLTQFQAIDSQFASTPLLTAPKTGFGFLASSYPFEYQSIYLNRDIQGFTNPGWEVELYQNDLYLGRRVADATGLYSFQTIPLFYGQNRFRLVFYGPQGEKRTQFQSYWIDGAQVKPGQLYYQVGAVDVNRDARMQARMDYGVTSFLSVSAGTVRYKLASTDEYRLGSYVQTQSFFPGFQISTVSAFSRGELLASGSAHEFKILKPIGIGTLSIGGTFLKSFYSESINPTTDSEQKRIYSLDWLHNVPFLPRLLMSHSLQAREYIDGLKDTGYLNRLTTQLGPVFLNHDANFNMSNQEARQSYAGVLNLNLPTRLGDFRSLNNYDADDLQSSTLELRKQLNVNTNFILGLKRDFLKRVMTENIQLTQAFRRWNGSLIASYTNPRDFTVGTQFGFSAFFDPVADKFRSEGVFQSGRGRALVRVFIDRDGNGKFDEGVDRALPRVAIRMGLNTQTWYSNHKGEIYLTELPVYTDLEIILLLDSLEDPSFFPRWERVGFWVKPANTETIEIPVAAFGQIEGVVSRKSKQGTENPEWGADVRLKGVDRNIDRRTRTDADGAFWFERVPPGTYTLELHRLESGGDFDVREGIRRIVIDPDGGYVTGQDFTISRKIHGRTKKTKIESVE